MQTPHGWNSDLQAACERVLEPIICKRNKKFQVLLDPDGTEIRDPEAIEAGGSLYLVFHDARGRPMVAASPSNRLELPLPEAQLRRAPRTTIDEDLLLGASGIPEILERLDSQTGLSESR